MMGLGTIRYLANEQAKKAKAKGLQPYIAKKDKDIKIKTCPNFGSYVPDGWILKQEFFVDALGLSFDAEMKIHDCISFEMLVEQVKKDRGYAIIEEGQFQIYIGEFVSDWELAGTPYTLAEHEADMNKG